jgi:hypothetical protein
MQNLPKLAAARSDKAAVIAAAASGGGVDIDLLHAMDRTDEALLADEILNGSRGRAFVYKFKIKNEEVAGISVIGAAHLARFYKGLKHRLVASVEKNGSLFRFTSYPSEGQPMQVTAAQVPELAADPDYYTVVIEVTDIKTGNSVQMERSELRMETRRDGTPYQRPNFQTIAQSKAYRNAVLRLVPQDVQIQFEKQCLALGEDIDITGNVIEQKRNGVMAFAARHAVPLSREAVWGLGWDQIAGLSDAARAEGVQQFIAAATALGLVGATIENDGGKPETAKKDEPKKQSPQLEDKRPAVQQSAAPEPEKEPVQETAKAEPEKPAKTRSAFDDE